MSNDLNRKNCRFCKKIIKKESEICFDCNTKNHNQNSDKILALSLCLFLGFWGFLYFICLALKRVLHLYLYLFYSFYLARQ